MPADLNHITRLLYRTIRGEVLPSEDEATLSAWAAESAYNREVMAKVLDENTFDQQLRQRLNENYEADWQKLLARMGNPEQPPAHRIHFLRTAWLRYAAAAIIILGVGTYLWNTQKQKEKPSVTTTNPFPMQNDVAPGGNKAVLTLANGKKIELDNAARGEIARERGATIEKRADGQLVYLSSKDAPAIIAYNTMTTPRGGQYQLVLPDGSRVWLNAASSITYPTAFVGQTREVSITGEAYFEVARDKTKPFRVKVAAQTIEVLGTHFNVNAYTDESGIKTTLLEGSVRIAKNVLRPGEAFINGKVVRTNVEQDVAWKNGTFDFNDLDVATAMRQLERWYDIRVVYDGAVPKGAFLGEVKRDLQLSQVINLLNGVVAKFRLEGRTLHVSQ